MRQCLGWRAKSMAIVGDAKASTKPVPGTGLWSLSFWLSVGRSGEIRTPDPLLPKQVRYQAALRSARPSGDARHGGHARFSSATLTAAAKRAAPAAFLENKARHGTGTKPTEASKALLIASDPAARNPS